MSDISDNETKKIIEEVINVQKFEKNREILLNKFKYSPKYITIRKIPILFLIFLVILISLLYVDYKDIDIKFKKIIDRIINLITGLIVVIAGVYLWTVRTEYHYLIQQLNNHKYNIKKYMERQEIDLIFNNLLTKKN